MKLDDTVTLIVGLLGIGMVAVLIVAIVSAVLA